MAAYVCNFGVDEADADIWGSLANHRAYVSSSRFRETQCLPPKIKVAFLAEEHMKVATIILEM